MKAHRIHIDSTCTLKCLFTLPYQNNRYILSHLFPIFPISLATNNGLNIVFFNSSSLKRRGIASLWFLLFSIYLFILGTEMIIGAVISHKLDNVQYLKK